MIPSIMKIVLNMQCNKTNSIAIKKILDIDELSLAHTAKIQGGVSNDKCSKCKFKCNVKQVIENTEINFKIN